MGRCSFASNSKRRREKHGAFFSQKIVADDDRLRRERTEFVVGFGWKRYWIYGSGSCIGAQDSHASGAANVLHQIKKDTRRCPFLFGAGSGGRTHTVLLPPDFESGASANSTIPAWNTILLYNSGGFISSKKFHSLPPTGKERGRGQVFGWNRRKRSGRIIQDFAIHSLNKCKNTSIIGENHRKAAE